VDPYADLFVSALRDRPVKLKSLKSLMSMRVGDCRHRLLQTVLDNSPEEIRQRTEEALRNFGMDLNQCAQQQWEKHQKHARQFRRAMRKQKRQAHAHEEDEVEFEDEEDAQDRAYEKEDEEDETEDEEHEEQPTLLPASLRARWTFCLRTLLVRLSRSEVNALTTALLSRVAAYKIPSSKAATSASAAAAALAAAGEASFPMLTWWLHETDSIPIQWLPLCVRNTLTIEEQEGVERPEQQSRIKKQVAALLHSRRVWLTTGPRVLRNELLLCTPLAADVLDLITQYIIPPSSSCPSDQQ
jgi:hypothetical protein